MTSIVRGPWLPPEYLSVKELQETLREREAEIQFLLRVARAAIFMKSELEGIALGKMLPAENRKAAERALRYVNAQFPQIVEMEDIGL